MKFMNESIVLERTQTLIPDAQPLAACAHHLLHHALVDTPQGEFYLHTKGKSTAIHSPAAFKLLPPSVERRMRAENNRDGVAIGHAPRACMHRQCALPAQFGMFGRIGGSGV